MLTDVGQIQGLLRRYRAQQDELYDHIASIGWYMRGHLSREDAWALSFRERKRYMHFIEERIKFVEKTNMPIL
jgi:hypothetical protein